MSNIRVDIAFNGLSGTITEKRRMTKARQLPQKEKTGRLFITGPAQRRIKDHGKSIPEGIAIILGKGMGRFVVQQARWRV